MGPDCGVKACRMVVIKSWLDPRKILDKDHQSPESLTLWLGDAWPHGQPGQMGSSSRAQEERPPPMIQASGTQRSDEQRVHMERTEDPPRQMRRPQVPGQQCRDRAGSGREGPTKSPSFPV